MMESESMLLQTYSAQNALMTKVRDKRIQELQSLENLYGDQIRATNRAIEVLRVERDGLQAIYEKNRSRLAQQQTSLKESISLQKARIYDTVSKVYEQKRDQTYAPPPISAQSRDLEEEDWATEPRQNLTVRNRSGEEFFVSFQGEVVEGLPAGWGTAHCTDGFQYTGWWTDGTDQGQKYNWMSGLVSVRSHDGKSQFIGHLGGIDPKTKTRYSGIGTQGRLFDWYKGRLQMMGESFEGKFNSNQPEVPCSMKVEWDSEFRNMEMRAIELKRQKQQISEAEISKMKETIIDELQLARVREILPEYLRLSL